MRYLFFSVLLITSFASHAAENKHNLGISYGLGTSNTDLNDETDDSIEQEGIFYEYRFNTHYAISIKYFEGVGDFDASCGCSNYRKLSFRNEQVSFKASMPISERWYAFGRAGINHYKTEYSGNFLHDDPQLPDRNQTGFGQVASAGFEFNAHSGFIVAFEYQYLTMTNGDIISLNISLGYTF